MAKKPPIAYRNGKLCSSTNKCPELEKFQKWAKEKDPSLLPVYGADGEWGPESEKAWAQEGQNYEQFQTEQKTTQKTEVEQKVKENEDLIRREKEKAEEVNREREILTGLQARYESELQRIRQPVSLDVPEQIEPKKHKGIIRGIVSFFKRNIGPNRTDGNSPVQGIVGPAPLNSLEDEKGQKQPGGFLPIGYIKTPFGDIKINPNISKIFNKNRSVSTQKEIVQESKEIYSEVFEDEETRNFKYGLTELRNSRNWPGGQVPAPVPAGKNDRESFPGGFDTRSWFRDPTTPPYSSGAIGTPFENEDPVYLTFEVEIDSLASPIINGRAEDFLNQYSNNLKELESRKKILHSFIWELSKFFKFNDNIFLLNLESMFASKLEKKHYVKKIQGLEKLMERNEPALYGAHTKYRTDTLVLSFYEDTMLSVGSLASLYKLLYWSRLNGKNIIPENLLRFDCKITVSEGRNIVRYKTKTVQTEDGKTITQGGYELVRENVSRYVYNLYECQFFFNKMSHPESIDLEATPQYSQLTDITVSYKYSNMNFQRFVFTDDVNGEYKDLNNGKLIPYEIGPADTNYAIISDREIKPVRKTEPDKSVSDINGTGTNDDTGLENDTGSVFSDDITGAADLTYDSEKNTYEEALRSTESGLEGGNFEEDFSGVLPGGFNGINDQKIYGESDKETSQGPLNNFDNDVATTGRKIKIQDPKNPGHTLTFTADGETWKCSECTKEQFDLLAAQIGQDAAYNPDLWANKILENAAIAKANTASSNQETFNEQISQILSQTNPQGLSEKELSEVVAKLNNQYGDSELNGPGFRVDKDDEGRPHIYFKNKDGEIRCSTCATNKGGPPYSWDNITLGDLKKMDNAAYGPDGSKISDNKNSVRTDQTRVVDKFTNMDLNAENAAAIAKKKEEAAKIQAKADEKKQKEKDEAARQKRIQNEKDPEFLNKEIERLSKLVNEYQYQTDQLGNKPQKWQTDNYNYALKMIPFYQGKLDKVLGRPSGAELAEKVIQTREKNEKAAEEETKKAQEIKDRIDNMRKMAQETGETDYIGKIGNQVALRDQLNPQNFDPNLVKRIQSSGITNPQNLGGLTSKTGSANEQDIGGGITLTGNAATAFQKKQEIDAARESVNQSLQYYKLKEKYIKQGGASLRDQVLGLALTYEPNYAKELGKEVFAENQKIAKGEIAIIEDTNKKNVRESLANNQITNLLYAGTPGGKTGGFNSAISSAVSTNVSLIEFAAEQAAIGTAGKFLVSGTFNRINQLAKTNVGQNFLRGVSSTISESKVANQTIAVVSGDVSGSLAQGFKVSPGLGNISLYPRTAALRQTIQTTKNLTGLTTNLAKTESTLSNFNTYYSVGKALITNEQSDYDNAKKNTTKDFYKTLIKENQKLFQGKGLSTGSLVTKGVLSLGYNFFLQQPGNYFQTSGLLTNYGTQFGFKLNSSSIYETFKLNPIQDAKNTIKGAIKTN